MTGEGDQVVLYVFMEGADGPVVIDEPAVPPHQVEFVVRYTPDGWRLVRIAGRLPS